MASQHLYAVRIDIRDGGRFPGRVRAGIVSHYEAGEPGSSSDGDG